MSSTEKDPDLSSFEFFLSSQLDLASKARVWMCVCVCKNEGEKETEWKWVKELQFKFRS